MPAQPTPSERTLKAQISAHESWAQTENRTARTAKARQALENKFLAEAGGDPQRAESLRKAYYARLALKSAQSRRRRGAAESPPTSTAAPRMGGSTAPSQNESSVIGGGTHA